MSLYRYLPYWRHIREEFRELLTSLSEGMFDYDVGGKTRSIGDIVVDLASAQRRLLNWAEHSDQAVDDFKVSDYPGRDAKLELIEEQWQRLETYAEELGREDLTRQNPHPARPGEYFSVYELLWEQMRYEVHHMGQVELLLRAWHREHPSEPSILLRTDTFTRKIHMTRSDEGDDAPAAAALTEETAASEEDDNEEGDGAYKTRKVASVPDPELVQGPAGDESPPNDAMPTEAPAERADVAPDENGEGTTSVAVAHPDAAPDEDSSDDTERLLKDEDVERMLSEKE